MPPARVAAPNVVDPCVNVTVPAGVAYAEVTVAVNVTDWPEFDGFFDEAIVVVVSHFDLLNEPTVYEQIKQWLT